MFISCFSFIAIAWFFFPSPASLTGDIKGCLEMEFPFNPLLLRSDSLVSDGNADYRSLGKNVLKTEVLKGKFILQGSKALKNVILS